MVQSIFSEYAFKYFKSLALGYLETVNGSKDPLKYLHKTLLRPDYSVSGQWSSVFAQHSLVAADIVSMDSDLPLKRRDVLGRASGDIPKQGMKLYLNEKQLTEIDTLIAQNAPEATIVAKIFADLKRVIGGIYESNEGLFLEMLSSGMALVSDLDTVGTGIRVNCGYYNENQFGTSGAVWSDKDNATPIDDIDRVLSKGTGDGNSIEHMYIDKFSFTNLMKTAQIIDLYAYNRNYVGDSKFAPDQDALKTLLQSKFGVGITIIDRTIRYERDGVRTSVKPWKEGAVVFTKSGELGSLTYARLAEQAHPVAGVDYQLVDNYILTSKFRSNTPSVAEFTTSQARVIPVITNVDQIYTLDSKTVQA